MLRIKHRDMFDLLWLQHSDVSFRPDMLSAKLPTVNRDGFVDILRRRASDGKEAMLNGEYVSELGRFLPKGSPWLFDDERKRVDASRAFEALILDHAKIVQRELTRTSVQRPKGITR